MTSADAAAGPMIRPLRGSDLDAVVTIDRAVVGRPRIPFHERRLAHLEREPDALVALAAELGGRESAAVAMPPVRMAPGPGWELRTGRNERQPVRQPAGEPAPNRWNSGKGKNQFSALRPVA